MAEQAIRKKELIPAKPILKWAGGKTQMLNDLLPKVPTSYGRYIEPFFGGGAMFFALQPESAIIADSNPELINMYRQVADYVDEVISYLEKYENTSEMFYSVRGQDWSVLPKAEAAARTIFLISKKAKALNEITDSWLKLQITTYTGIEESAFDQYSDISWKRRTTAIACGATLFPAIIRHT